MLAYCLHNDIVIIHTGKVPYRGGMESRGMESTSRPPHFLVEMRTRNRFVVWSTLTGAGSGEITKIHIFSMEMSQRSSDDMMLSL